MNKPEGFNVEELYENIVQEQENKRLKKIKHLPKEVCDLIVKCRKNDLSWDAIADGLNKAGYKYTKSQLRYRFLRDEENNLLD